MKLRRETLTAAQAAALERVGPIAAAEQLYLAGGTALALRLGHRRSEDFDWFSEQPLEDPERMVRRLRARGLLVETQLVEAGTIYAEVEGVRTSIIQFPYPPLRPVESIEGVPLAHLDDLACMKLDALATRGVRKDFIDVHALCRAHAPLSVLLERYRARFPKANVVQLLMSLTYFENAERSPMPVLLEGVSWADVELDFVAWADAIELS